MSNRQVDQRQVWVAADRARSLAITVQVIGWLEVLGGVITGVSVALHTRCEGTDQFGSCLTKTHPFVAAGIGVAVGAAVSGLLLAVAGAYVQMRSLSAMMANQFVPAAD